MGQIGADRRPQSLKPIRSLSLSFSLSLSLSLLPSLSLFLFPSPSSLWYYRFRVYGALLAATAAARQPFAYMLPAIWQTAWRKRRLQCRRYNAHVSLIRHETSRRVFERRYNDRGRRERQSKAKGANIGSDWRKLERPFDTECPGRNDTYRRLKYACYPSIVAWRRKSFEEKNLTDTRYLVNFTRHFRDILNQIIFRNSCEEY